MLEGLGQCGECRAPWHQALPLLSFPVASRATSLFSTFSHVLGVCLVTSSTSLGLSEGGGCSCFSFGKALVLLVTSCFVSPRKSRKCNLSLSLYTYVSLLCRYVFCCSG